MSILLDWCIEQTKNSISGVVGVSISDSEAEPIAKEIEVGIREFYKDLGLPYSEDEVLLVKLAEKHVPFTISE